MEGFQLNRYFALLTFVAKQRSHDLCGSNGLPLTPNSIKILGRAQLLKTLHHPNLFSYIDFLRGKHGRTVIVSEHYGTPLEGFSFRNWLEVINFARDVLRALAYLHKNGIVHNSLTKRNILISNNCWKLFNYGLYYMTDNGLDVLFPIGNLYYSAPEVILQGPNQRTSGKSDIWSLGIILVEILLDCEISESTSFSACLKQCLSFINVKDVFYYIAEKYDKCHIFKKLPQDIINLVNKMLFINPLDRPSARQLLEEEIFTTIDYEKKFIWRKNEDNITTLDRQSSLELYHYWQLAGGDVYAELKREGLIRTNPPILTIPNLLLLEGACYGQKTGEADSFDEQLVFLTVYHLVERFTNFSIHKKIKNLHSLLKEREILDAAHLPVAIKERDTDYQFRRIQLFKHLFTLLPEKRTLLLKESRQDIPPFLRARIWSLILKIPKGYISHYKSIDKETPMQTDRQIEVDIPRCHQYNELLSSSAGHIKFKRILKAWVRSHPEYVYWQGLDSLCAPFLNLNFYNEARAYACLTKFISKYLHNFFLRDNSAIIKEYLAKFKHLIAFLDPVLARHLHVIGFSPELFAIPWFLTMFSHVFPIQKILNLWDALLLGNASFPLFIGFSILQQLRSVLLESGFNECILLFSDLPEIDIEKCVKHSICCSKSTPRSITFRRHEILNDSDTRLLMGLMLPEYTLDDMINEYCPRISAEEVKKMVQEPLIRQNIILIDLRHPTIFMDAHVPGSINMHRVDLKPEKQLSDIFGPKSELHAILQNKGKYIIVIGDYDVENNEFCEFLSKSGVPKVSFVHGGIKALLSSLKQVS